MPTFTMTAYDPDLARRTTRTYWCSDRGGYVYDVTDRPGTLGRQVSYALGGSGDMMEVPSPDDLPRAVRAAQRRRLRAWRRACA